jgi:hypothetical protein
MWLRQEQNPHTIAGGLPGVIQTHCYWTSWDHISLSEKVDFFIKEVRVGEIGFPYQRSGAWARRSRVGPEGQCPWHFSLPPSLHSWAHPHQLVIGDLLPPLFLFLVPSRDRLTKTHKTVVLPLGCSQMAWGPG